jgi:hypothetical protein
MQEGEEDEDITTNDTSTPTPASTSPTPLGPIIRTRARRLIPQVSLTLKLRFIIFRQWRHVHSCFTQEQWSGSNGKRHYVGWIRTAAQTRIVMAATTSSELHFGHSSTSWKAYQIKFPTDPKSPPYLFGVNRNR